MDVIRAIAVAIIFIQVLVLGTVSFVLMTVLLVFPPYNKLNPYGEWQKDVDANPSFYWWIIFICLLGCFFALLVLYAMVKNQPYWLLPWIIYCLIVTFALVVVLILRISRYKTLEQTIKEVLILLLVLVVPIYATFVMTLLFLKMSKRKRLATLC